MSSAVVSLLLVIALWAWLTLLCCTTQRLPTALSPSQKAYVQVDKDKACNTVERLRKAGAFTKIEADYGGVTHAYADRDFFAIPVDAKESALKAVALCYIDLDKQQQLGIVIIHKGYTGKKIGTDDFASGLNLD